MDFLGGGIECPRGVSFPRPDGELNDYDVMLWSPVVSKSRRQRNFALIDFGRDPVILSPNR